MANAPKILATRPSSSPAHPARGVHGGGRVHRDVRRGCRRDVPPSFPPRHVTAPETDADDEDQETVLQDAPRARRDEGRVCLLVPVVLLVLAVTTVLLLVLVLGRETTRWWRECAAGGHRVGCGGDVVTIVLVLVVLVVGVGSERWGCGTSRHSTHIYLKAIFLLLIAWGMIRSEDASPLVAACACDRGDGGHLLQDEELQGIVGRLVAVLRALLSSPDTGMTEVRGWGWGMSEVLVLVGARYDDDDEEEMLQDEKGRATSCSLALSDTGIRRASGQEAMQHSGVKAADGGAARARVRAYVEVFSREEGRVARTATSRAGVASQKGPKQTATELRHQ
ncbi:hypothetical protein B0H10DRAFT_1965802 [Mycena sp. CBHHK59/15]|nr:hypothetical protein B0H10DRAFT_1965802 [Mycena sp. CBHHK59/15]